MQKTRECCAVVEPLQDDTSNCLITADGRQYTGTVSQTVSGRTCQQWASQSPHDHYYTEIDMFPDRDAKLADVRNYCRNPLTGSSYKSLPWCYTTSSNVEWEFCNVPRCKGTTDECSRALFVEIVSSVHCLYIETTLTMIFVSAALPLLYQ